MSGAFQGERAVVVGFGVSGRAAVEALVAEGATVRVSEARPVDDLEAGPEGATAIEAARAAGVELMGGGHRPEHLNGATLVVVSPGVPEGSPVIGWARDRNLRVWSELELGSHLCRVPLVAVTGTNGKTTTTEMVAAAMRAAGIAARACGNVGYPFPLAARSPEHQALVVECSSFQLVFQESFHPKVSVLLNVAPDHLDWHGSFDRYAEAKARVFLNQAGGDVHLGNRDDPTGSTLSGRAGCEVRWFRWGIPKGTDVGVVDGEIVGGDGADYGRPRGIGRGFLSDAAAAAAASSAFGVRDDAIRSALQTFLPLPHRGAVVAEAGGVRFVDDSKATNPHAALAALEGVTNTVLIAGGLAKGVDLSPLAQAAAGLTGVVAIGEAAGELHRVFDGLVRTWTASSMPEAVELAYAASAPGSTVLLAPACASQDMFRDYRDRGEQFAAAARDLVARSSASAAAGGDRHA